MKQAKLQKDKNGVSMPIVDLSASQIVDGTNVSAQSAAIDGTTIRICNYSDTVAWVARGTNPTALNDTDQGGPSVPVLPNSVEFLPIIQNTKVAVKGAKVCISVVGE